MTQHSQPLDLAEALAHLTQTITPVRETQSVAIEDATSRITAKAIYAPVDMPPFAASAMDGYALRERDWLANPQANFALIGQSFAGRPYPGDVGPGQAVRIYTGAVLPNGADRVILQEQVLQATQDSVSFNAPSTSESYVRPRAHDVAEGSLLVPGNTHLTAFHQGMLAACGVPQLKVLRKPKVGVFSTGDELVDPSVSPLKAGQIYDSNRLTVLNLLVQLPIELVDLGCLPDQQEVVMDAIDRGAQACDALITSGGVSVGDADFVTDTIRRLGELKFWRLNLKPGKPLAYGQIKTTSGHCHVFGLPGNPVSTIVTLLLVAKPALLHLAGTQTPQPLRVWATLGAPLQHSPGRTEFQRGVMSTDQDANLLVSHTGDQSSNRLSTFAQANCLIEVPKDADNLPPGTKVLVLPFSGLV